MIRKAALIVAIGLGVSAPLAAAGAYNDFNSRCDAYEVCIYGNDAFKWLIGDRAGNQGTLNVGSNENDEMDSYNNKSNYTASWYQDASGGGDCYTMGYRTADDNIAFWRSDKLSSWNTSHGC